MATVTITLIPDLDTWTTGDAPIEVQLSAEISPGDQVLWESSGGTFSDRFATPAFFTPNNATKSITITGNRVNRYDSISSNGTLIPYGTQGGYGKDSGALAWNTWYVMDYPVSTGTGVTAFFEQEPVDNTSEKAMGFITNANFPDPKLVGGIGAAFEHAWHLSTDGTAVPRKLGTALSSPVTYKAGDRFRVTLKDTQAIYTLNGNIIAIGERVTSALLYAYNSWKSIGGHFDNVSYLTDAANQAFDTVAVTGLFPLQPNYTYEISTDVGILTSPAIDGTEKRRKKSKERRVYNLQFNDRPYSEYQQVLAFWNAHEKHEKFVYYDIDMAEALIMRFDAPLGINVLGTSNIEIKAVLKEV
jgi:hypothetical protein